MNMSQNVYLENQLIKEWKKARLEQLIKTGVLCKPPVETEIRVGYARNIIISPTKLRENKAELAIRLSDITQQLTVLKKVVTRPPLTTFDPSELQKEIERVRGNLRPCTTVISGIPVIHKNVDNDKIETVEPMSWGTYIYSFFFKVN